MKNMVSLKFIFLVHVVFVPLNQCYADLVETTCKNTPDNNLCVSTLHSDPNSAKADVPGLVVIGANILKTKATATLNQINGLMKGAQDPELQKALKSCVDFYNTILKYDLPEVIEAVTKGNPKFAAQGASDAATEAESCEKSFTNTLQSPLTSQNNFVQDFSLVVTSIVNTLL